MDLIWDRKSFEVGGHWPLWWGWKNPNDHAEPVVVVITPGKPNQYYSCRF